MNDNETTRRAWTVPLVAGLGAAVAAGTGYVLYRARRHEAPAKELPPSFGLPEGTRHLDVPVRDGGSIHVAEWGSGPPIVFLHGVTLAAEVWARQFRDLGARHRTIALDVRGHGESEPGEQGMTIAAMADDVADVLQALDLRHVTLVGHSMGGMAVLRFVRRHPNVMAERVGAVAILASAGGISPPLSSFHRVAPQAAALAIAGNRIVNRRGRPLLPSSTAGERMTRVVFGEKPDRAAIRQTAELARRMHPERFIALLPELVGFDERAGFEELGVPAVVVVGDRDKVTPEVYARALVETLPGARLLVWQGAGHMLMYERPEELCQLLEELSATAEKGHPAARRTSEPD